MDRIEAIGASIHQQQLAGRRQSGEGGRMNITAELQAQHIAALEADLAQARAEYKRLRDAARAVCQAQNFTEAQQAVRALNTVLLDAARKEGEGNG